MLKNKIEQDQKNMYAKLLTFLIALLSVAGCGDNMPPPDRHLPRYMDLALTLEEEYCNGEGFRVGGPYETQGKMYVVDNNHDPEAIDVHFFPEEAWGYNFRDVRVEDNGHFSVWSHYAFIREGEVLVPLFNLLEGDAVETGFSARYTMYTSEGPNNHLAISDCRYVWLVENTSPY